MSNETVITAKVKKITLRDNKEYAVKPLSINELIKVWPIIKRLEEQADNVSIEMLDDIKELASVALGNQVAGGVDVGDLVDMVDIQAIIGAIMGQSN